MFFTTLRGKNECNESREPRQLERNPRIHKPPLERRRRVSLACPHQPPATRPVSPSRASRRVVLVLYELHRKLTLRTTHFMGKIQLFTQIVQYPYKYLDRATVLYCTV